MIFLLLLFLLPVTANATNYYMSPSGSDGAAGTSTGTAWLTFSKAFTTAACGDTINLADGVYGDGTSTGKISTTKVCTAGTELTIRCINSRQCRVSDNGGGKAILANTAAYLIFDGLVFNSANSSTSSNGEPMEIRSSNHITVRNSLCRNPNAYQNHHCIWVMFSSDIVIEDTEIYNYHRHGIIGWQSQRVTARRVYCNPRTGRITGGYNASAGIPGADACFSMYPCQDCIAENVINDATTIPSYLNEMNATFGSSVLMSGSKILGSICVACTYGNTIYLSSRLVADQNHSPQSITIQDVASVDHASPGSAFLRVSDGVSITVNRITMLTSGGAGYGILAEDTTLGVAPASQSIAITNSIISGNTLNAYRVSSGGTYSGDYLYAYNTGGFSPALPGNWTNTFTTDPGLGTCKVFIPTGAAAKGAGLSGSDIGANILYRYVDGILTTTQLWDETTGEFPHGVVDLDSTNSNSLNSASNIHTRLNVDTGGCSFPTGYVTGTGGGSTPSVVQGNTGSGSGTTSATWSQTVTAGYDRLVVAIALYDSGANVGSVSAVDSSGQALSLIASSRKVTSPAYRACELWQVQNPTSGSRTITVSTTGSVGGVVGRSVEFDLTTGPGTASTATALSSTPSVTVTTNTNEIVMDCVATSTSQTASAGANQTEYTAVDNGSVPLRLASSYQSGSNGGVMSWTLGGNIYWAQSAVSMVATPPDTPSSAVLSLSKYRFYSAFSTNGSESSANAIGSESTSTEITTNGEFRLRVEVTGTVATTSPFGISLYCQKNSGGYTQVTNSIGAHGIRLYGSGTVTDMPADLTSSTQVFTPSGSFVTGTVYRNANSTFTIPALTAGQKTEIVFIGASSLSSGDTVNCQLRKDDGSQLDAYTVTPTLTSIGNRSIAGY